MNGVGDGNRLLADRGALTHFPFLLNGGVMSDHHHHDDDHVREHDRSLSGPALRVKALESLLVEKGLVDPKTLDEIIDTFETKVGPRNGARVVARAWIDPVYKQRLLT